MTTLRPRGPSVTFTASARASTPRCSASRASLWNSRIFGMPGTLVRRVLTQQAGADAAAGNAERAAGAGCPTARSGALVLLADDREDVAGRQDEVLVGAVLHLGAAVLGEDDRVALGDVQREPLAVLEAPGADGEHEALLRLLLRGVRDHDAGRRRLLALLDGHDDAVLERLDRGLGGGRHDLTSC